MKLHNGKEVFYTFKNGEKQGDNNSVDYFSKQLCVMCEVKVTNTDKFSREYDIEVFLASKQGESADELQLFTQIWFH